MASSDDVSLERLQQHIDASYANRMALRQAIRDGDSSIQQALDIVKMQDGVERRAALALWRADLARRREIDAKNDAESERLLDEHVALYDALVRHKHLLHFH